jgi:hypothetical protein
MQVNVVATAVAQDVETPVRQALGMHAGADPGFVEQVDRDLFENAGADAAEDVVAGLGFEDYGIDAGAMQ